VSSLLVAVTIAAGIFTIFQQPALLFRQRLRLSRLKPVDSSGYFVDRAYQPLQRLHRLKFHLPFRAEPGTHTNPAIFRLCDIIGINRHGNCKF
jgi:hypothetical protein